MDKKSLMTNFKLMFTMYMILILFIIMFLLSFPITANALEVSDWTESNTILISEVDSAPYYTYDNYDSVTIMNNIYNWSNDQFFESTYTIEEFYSIFTYVIYSVDESTVRAYVQNAPLILDWQGISTTNSEITFYLSNVLGTVDNGSRYAYGVGIIYSYYIDINLSNLSYVISNNNPLLDVSMNKLTSVTSGDTSYNLNIKMLDSYNGNISWISTWNDLYNNSGLWRSISGYTGSLSVTYSTNPNAIIPDFLYTSPGVDIPDDPEEPDDILPSWVQSIIDKLESSNDINDQTNEKLEGIGSILERLEDFSDDTNQTINDILDWFTQNWDLDPIENFLENFQENDYGLDIFITGPVELISDLDGSLCEPIIINLPFVDSNIVLPCMTEFYNEHVPDFLSWYQFLARCLTIYFVGRGCYNAIHDLLDPRSNDSVVRGVM